jgi:hypothetical protein
MHLGDGTGPTTMAALPAIASKVLWSRLTVNKRDTYTHSDRSIDVGILSNRQLQDTSADEMCAMFEESFEDVEAVCDCSTWKTTYGTIECQTSGSVCRNQGGVNVCGSGKGTIAVDKNATFSITSCYTLTKPEFHEYCFKIEASLNPAVTFQPSCYIESDGVTCRSCAVDTECMGGPAVGDFDCSNTGSGSEGNMCSGDFPFPLLDGFLEAGPAIPVASPGRKPTPQPTIARDNPDVPTTSNTWKPWYAGYIAVGLISLFLATN